MTQKNPIEFLDIFKSFTTKMAMPQVSADMFPSFTPLPGMTAADPFGLVGKSQDRLSALVKANETTAEMFREHALRQSQIFNDVMKAAQENAGKMEMNIDAESQKKNLDLYAEAYERAVEMMQLLADETREASEAAFQKISKQVQSNIKDMSK